MSTKNTVRLHRVLATKPEKVYRAFLEPDAKARWLPPNGFTGKVHEHSAKVGGSYKISFTNFTTGTTHGFGGTYHVITHISVGSESNLAGHAEPHLLKSSPIATDGAGTDGRGNSEQAVRTAVR